jgi:hypothetical protein
LQITTGVFGVVFHKSLPTRSAPRRCGSLLAHSARSGTNRCWRGRCLGVADRCRQGWRRGVADRFRCVRRGESHIAAGEVGAKALRITTGVFGAVNHKSLPARSTPRRCGSAPTVCCTSFRRIVIPVLLGCDSHAAPNQTFCHGSIRLRHGYGVLLHERSVTSCA